MRAKEKNLLVRQSFSDGGSSDPKGCREREKQ
jgi:hypothetical protein